VREYLHAAPNLRWWRHARGLWLHADDLRGAGQELRHYSGYLWRNTELWHVYGDSPDLRRWGNAQCLRLPGKRDGYHRPHALLR
jgi:hypothetical protein